MVFCTKCGVQNEDTGQICVKCGASLQPVSLTSPSISSVAANTAAIPNYLVQSILCTVCCCIPLGIPAIVYSSQVNAKSAAGDIDGARVASNNAKKWCWIAFGVGLVVQGLILAANLAAFIAGFNRGFHR